MIETNKISALKKNYFVKNTMDHILVMLRIKSL